jgi:hypothetical protein
MGGGGSLLTQMASKQLIGWPAVAQQLRSSWQLWFSLRQRQRPYGFFPFFLSQKPVQH